MKAKNNSTIWDLIEASSIKVDAQAVKSAKKDSKTEEEKKKDLKKIKRWVRLADLLSLVFWTYVISKLFVFDLDVKLISLLGNDLSWLLWFKSIFFLGLIFLISLFLWKWKTLVAVLYVLFFPIIVLAWKVPRILYRRKSWIAVVATINGIGILIKNFKYNLTVKTLGLISAILILFTQINWLVIPAAIIIIVLLSWGLVRTVKLSFTKDWFLDFHRRVITKVIDSKLVNNFTSVSPEIKKAEVKILDTTHCQT